MSSAPVDAGRGDRHELVLRGVAEVVEADDQPLLEEGHVEAEVVLQHALPLQFRVAHADRYGAHARVIEVVVVVFVGRDGLVGISGRLAVVAPRPRQAQHVDPLGPLEECLLVEVPSQTERPHGREAVLRTVGRRTGGAVGDVGEVAVAEVEVAAGEESHLGQERLGARRQGGRAVPERVFDVRQVVLEEAYRRGVRRGRIGVLDVGAGIDHEAVPRSSRLRP